MLEWKVYVIWPYLFVCAISAKVADDNFYYSTIAEGVLLKAILNKLVQDS